jgi:hypothetical protein
MMTGMNCLMKRLSVRSAHVVTRNLSKSTPKMKPFRKHPQVRENRPLIQKQRKINEEHELAAEKLGLPWRIVAAS